MILLLWKCSPHLCPCLRRSLLLQTHQLCDNSKALYDTCFISLVVKGLHFCQMPPYREKVKLFSPRIREFLFYLYSFEYELFSFNDFISFCWPKGERQRFGSRQLTPQKAEILRDTAQNSYIHMPYTDSFQFVLYTCCNFNGLLCLRIWRFPSLL